MELALALYLIEEEEVESIIRLTYRRVPRRSVHNIFAIRKREGTFFNLITRHLLDDEVKFHAFFRLTRNQFDFVLSAIKADIVKAKTNMVQRPITPEEKLGITLRYLATGESLRSLAFGFRISHCHISRICRMVMSAVCKRLVPILLPPPTENDCKRISTEFWERWQFPNCVGAIDGKHVRITCPGKSGSLFFNYKDYFSIVLLAIVDARYKFVAVDIGSYGKEGDSGIFAKSVMGKQIFNGTYSFPPDNELPNSQRSLPYVIVGDEAFRLHKHIMKPYSRKQAKECFEKAVFNYRLSRARRVSENAFGLLCQTFRVFFTSIALKSSTVDLMIMSAVCLHNLIRNEYECMRQISNENDAEMKMTPERRNMIPLARGGGYANAEGFVVRESFKNYFVAEGKVDWQDNTVSRT